MNPKQYTKKPITILAMELTPETIYAVVDWLGLQNTDAFDIATCEIRIKTIEGVMLASRGDFVICGVKGEFYPCKADIFHMSYNEELS